MRATTDPNPKGAIDEECAEIPLSGDRGCLPRKPFWVGGIGEAGSFRGCEGEGCKANRSFWLYEFALTSHRILG